MDMTTGVMRAIANKGRPHRVFDWEEAARRIAEARPNSSWAGMLEDWANVGGEIYRDGRPLSREETYTYLSSNWDTPALEMDGERSQCWRYEADTPGWDARTFWPPEALLILKAGLLRPPELDEGVPPSVLADWLEDAGRSEDAAQLRAAMAAASAARNQR